MNKSYDVRFWNVTVKKGRKRPYVLRWRVGGKVQTRPFTTQELAASYKSELIQAARRGEAFDIDSGLPESMIRAALSVTWYRHARDYVDDRWDKVSAKQRISIAETLTAVTVALTTSHKGAPDSETLRNALRRWEYNKARRETDRPAEVAAALSWASRASVPLAHLAEFEGITLALGACARKLDGTAASPSYYTRRRRVLYNVLKYAVQRKRLTVNPIDGLDWKPIEDDEVWEEVDPAAVPSPRQMEELLTAVSYAGPRRGPRLVAFYACIYYAMMRPGEVVSLREDDCELPSMGWGRLMLAGSKPSVGTEWTDSGEYHDDRGLKGRSRKAKRPVPIPPQLVRILRDHITQHGIAPDGRLFRTERGGVLLPSGYGQTWHMARELALTPAEVASDLARRPYDLRHAGVSLRLNAGVPPTQVAAWAGHSVEVLLRIYAKVVAGLDSLWEGPSTTPSAARSWNTNGTRSVAFRVPWWHLMSPGP
ncbi:tyrosine-type recombinase/integrase [Actinomadura chibensis]|uniref:tyrosine-type recombinase/integrase n=1 Tax=Actinomadura chibensis TaxID=392828 RepID=UPI000A5C2625|nr:site-specific integrase [Actinomadura chibensis]